MRAAIYCRVNPSEEASISEQEIYLRKCARKLGSSVVIQASDVMEPTTLVRPGLNAVNEAVVTQEVDVVLVASVKSISNHPMEWYDYQRFLVNHRVVAICPEIDKWAAPSE